MRGDELRFRHLLFKQLLAKIPPQFNKCATLATLLCQGFFMNETNPLLESDILTCPHKGIVQLKGLCGDLLEVEGVGVITKSEKA